MVQVDLRRNPHGRRGSTKGLVAVGFTSAAEDHDLLFIACIRAAYDERLIAFVFPPVTLVSEDVFEAETVAVAYIQLGDCSRAPCRQEYLVRVGLQLIGECLDVINRLACADSSLCDVIGVVAAGPDVGLVFLGEVKINRLPPLHFPPCLPASERPVLRPHRLHLLRLRRSPHQ